VKQSLGRQSGVQNVNVSLLDGKVDVTPKEDGQIDPAQLLKATYDSGVSVAEMDVTARGSAFSFRVARKSTVSSNPAPSATES
jgi:hypothetical protein